MGRGGLRLERGELVGKPAKKPVPEEVARIWAEEWAKEGKRRWTGRGSHAAARISGVAEEVGGRADAFS